MIKKILIFTLSLVTLSTPISLNLCLETELKTWADESSSSYEENHLDHTDHHQNTCHDGPYNKSICQYNHSCCSLAITSTLSYLTVLDSCLLNPSEIPFQPFEMTESFYHPPRT